MAKRNKNSQNLSEENKDLNKGEWAEVYAFLKIISDQKIDLSDLNFNPIPNSTLEVKGVIRAEKKNEFYCYKTGDFVQIYLNGKFIQEVSTQDFQQYKNYLWKSITDSNSTTFSDPKVVEFLKTIFVTKPKASAGLLNEKYGGGKKEGGTIDIVLQLKDLNGDLREFGFSVKSDIKSAATLFNASEDNTNFLFEIIGDFDDEKMKYFNELTKLKKGEQTDEVATKERIQFLKSCRCDIEYVGTVKPIALRNLTVAGGKELHRIIAGLLKNFYWEHLGSSIKVGSCIDYLTKNDVAQYKSFFEEFKKSPTLHTQKRDGYNILYSNSLKEIYTFKIKELLFYCFSGLKLGSLWNGNSKVNGGIIMVKENGKIVVFYSMLGEEFRALLLNTIYMEAPSHKRHKDMFITKIENRYYLKLGLQFRIKIRKRRTKSQINQ